MAEGLAFIFIALWNVFLYWVYRKMFAMHRNTIDAYGETGYPIRQQPPRLVSNTIELLDGAMEYNRKTAIIADLNRNALKKEGLDV